MKKIDYAKLLTEQRNPRTRNLDRLDTAGILRLMHHEDMSVPRAVWKVRKQVARGVDMVVAAVRAKGRVFFAGAGTSGRLGVLEAAECPPTFNTPPGLFQAVIAGGKKAVFRSQEGAEDREQEAFRIFSKKLRRGDLVIGIAASGVTPFVRGALRAARKKQNKTILVSCNKKTLPRELVDCLIVPETGPEVISGSTRLKAGTATKLVLNMLTAASMVRLGKVYENWMVDLQPKSKKLRSRALRIIQHLGEVSPREAENCLAESRRNVKVAILMAKKGWDYEQARSRLKETAGFLGKALS
ncbi:MAG TPA: N-acetylmuramic acid 6-phosphate etherase [Verrucomicrobiae bacterium]|jgi:N-acetylmuramic acid 6-phosphate etherase|nr:N-acetylmuramic acid 6-phosphate etherase [Verrucomicrobiae bacterium]